MTQAQVDSVKNLVDAIFMMRAYWSQVTQEIKQLLWQQVLDCDDAVGNAGIDENTFSPVQYETLGVLRDALVPFRNDWNWEDTDAQNALWAPVSQAADAVNVAFEFGGSGQLSTSGAPEVEL